MLANRNPQAAATEKLRVLVVDDSVVIRRLIVDALSNQPDIEVIGTAANGVLALERVKRDKPDIVTLDIEMPEMDGLTTLRHIKAFNRRTRVIMCSTLTERGAGVTLDAMQSGADDYVTKASNQAGSTGLTALKTPLLAKIRQFKRSAAPVRAAGTPPVVHRPRTSGIAIAQKKPRAIVIGVSTGGPNALAEVIPGLSANLPVPVLIVQHMPAMFTRLLADRLQSTSKIKVVEGAEGMAVRPGVAYIAPGNYHMAIEGDLKAPVLRLNQDPMENSCRPAVDVLFRSAAKFYDGATIAVILTGMGQDGLAGIRELRSKGSTVIAQDEASSVVWGMPGFVVREGLADYVCDLRGVASQIIEQI
ncbi:MAG: chemotaxis response regulator protein-glutamate methylesterase [Acidobacteria bacterium]|nr:chemotaxis response regulator protein-glutamate methylesterase [Acidobacteriota bacterium]